MKKLFKPASIAFNFLMLIVFFFIGLTVAGIVGAGKGQMLAGGAIVFGWGVLFAATAFFTSFFITYNVLHKHIVRLNWILLLVCLVLYGITHYRFSERQKEKEDSNTEQLQKKPTQPTNAKPVSMNLEIKAKEENPITIKLDQSSQSIMGVGFFSPHIFEHPTLYFYDGVNLEKEFTDHSAIDSVIFAKDEYNNPTTTYAPPWLFPEHLKLDYGIIIFKAIGIGHDFVKVEANKLTKQVIYLDKFKGDLMTWPEFLLSINSVELNENSSKKIFIKPLDYADEVKVDFDFMQPILVEQDWMYVRLVKEDLKEKGKGWIRWKKDNLLLISYSLLS